MTTGTGADSTGKLTDGVYVLGTVGGYQHINPYEYDVDDNYEYMLTVKICEYGEIGDVTWFFTNTEEPQAILTYFQYNINPMRLSV